MRKSIVVAGALVMLAAQAQAQTWDLATDFLETANPNGEWSYGQLVASVFTPATLGYIDNGPATGPFHWWGYFPNPTHPAVGVNEGSARDYGIGAGFASLECDVLTPDARWTAPLDGTYDIFLEMGSGLVDGPDGHGDSHVDRANLSIDGAIQSPDSFGGNVKIWNKEVFLNQGDTVDAWVGQANDGGNTQTTFTVTSVPEPASLSVLALAALPALHRRRQRLGRA